ncbi:MAG: hypothetical protein QOF29_2443, partial [bacterium]
YFPAPNGGAVWSASSIAFCGSLSHDNYENNISRLTQNVLDRLASDEPPPPGAERGRFGGSAEGVQERRGGGG